MVRHFRYGKLSCRRSGLDRRSACMQLFSPLACLAPVLPAALAPPSRHSRLRSRPFPMFRGGSPESEDPFAGTPSCPNRLKSWWSWCGAPRAAPVCLTPSSAAGRKVPGLGSPFQRRLLGSGSGPDAPRAPRTLSQFPRPAQKLDFPETPCRPWRERLSRRMVPLEAGAPQPLPGLPVGWRGKRVAGGLR